MNSVTPPRTFTRGASFALVGELHRVLATSQDTGGQLFAMEITVSPGGGTPPHLHAHEDETFYPVDGEIEVWLDGQTHRLRPGEMAYGPRGVPHYFRNPGERPVRLQVLAFPGTAERFFAEAGRLLPSADAAITPPSDDEIGRLLTIATDHGIRILPPG